MDYVFWKTTADPGYCVCKALQGFDDDYLIAYGQPVADRFPDDTHYTMSDELPNDIQLADAVKNYGSYLLLSARLKAFIEERTDDRIEFLPTKILNHKGRVAAADYFIANVLEIHDAIDLDQSVVKWNNIDPDKISRFRKLVLDTDRLPEERVMLRLKHFPGRVLVRRDFAEELEGAGFTGLSFVETEGFKR